MFGKVMSITDDLIMKYFTLATRVPSSDLIGVESQLKGGANPRDIKVRLAREIVKMYHSDKAAETASVGFDKQFKEGQMPEEMEAVAVDYGDWEITDLLAKTKLVSSKSEGRRMVEQGGVKIDGEKITSFGKVEVSSGLVISVGKRKFVRIK
jgi:tyrosyl-tRNA synthetase